MIQVYTDGQVVRNENVIFLRRLNTYKVIMNTMGSMGRVMIVDDDAHVRIAVKTVLEDEGFQVIMADSGLACVDQIRKGFTGLILLDIMMPEMDGWDTIEKILEEDLFHGIVITMLTAKNNPDNRMIGLQEYVVDYLTKPFESDELIKKILFYIGFIDNTTNNIRTSSIK